MAVFPSKEWVGAVLAAAEKSEKYKEAAKDWEGDFLCIIEGDEEFLKDMGKRKVLEGFMSFLDMMPPKARKKYAGTPMGDIFEKKLGIPLDASVKDINVDKVAGLVSRLSAGDLKGASVYFWADFWHGSVRAMEPVAPGEHKDAAFKLWGKYTAWKMMVSGQQDTIRLIMSNKLKLEGDMSYVMKNMKGVITLTKEVFAGVPIE